MRLVLWIGLGALVVIASAAIVPFLLPDDAVIINEGPPEGTMTPPSTPSDDGRDNGTRDGGSQAGGNESSTASMAHASGTMRGEKGHAASGSVYLLQVGDGWFLRFEDLDMTAGPDIYLYLIESEGTTKAKVESGHLIPVITDADSSPRINERGSFNVRIPSAIDPMDYAGISVWCERFGTAFATAPLG